jgi:hypothetical protein
MAMAETTITLAAGEYALVVGQEGERMSVRTEGAALPEDSEAELPIPAAIVAALAERLVHDPDFHDEILEWVEAHLDDDEDEAGSA